MSNKYYNHLVIIWALLGVDFLVNFLSSTAILSHIFCNCLATIDNFHNLIFVFFLVNYRSNWLGRLRLKSPDSARVLRFRRSRTLASGRSLRSFECVTWRPFFTLTPIICKTNLLSLVSLRFDNNYSLHLKKILKSQSISSLTKIIERIIKIYKIKWILWKYNQ